MKIKNEKDLGGILSGVEKLLDYTLNFLIGYITYFITKFRYHNEFSLGQNRAVLIISLAALMLFFLYNHYEL